MWTISKTRRLLAVALLAAGVAAATPACAAQTYGYRGGGGQRDDVARRAYNSGYREGLEDGREDARRRRSFSYERHDEYRDATRGYRTGSDRGWYSQAFRQGFEVGYREAYDRNGRALGGYQNPRGGAAYPPSAVYRSPAADIGYRDGIEAGRDDARDGDRYDPVRSSRYRSGDHDYNSRYGSRDDFKREYRDAFQRGYDEGYRGRRR